MLSLALALTAGAAHAQPAPSREAPLPPLVKWQGASEALIVSADNRWITPSERSGLTTTHLAGRTLADLVLGRDTDLTALPWVNRDVRRWEPEPLRWLGVRAMYGLYREADRREDKGLDRPSRLARIGDRLTGR